ncbi:MAG: hypothetical protein AAB217_14580 [Chloroflexota bacterium]
MNIQNHVGSWRSIRRAINWFRWIWRPTVVVGVGTDTHPHCCYEEDED